MKSTFKNYHPKLQTVQTAALWF